MTTESREPVLLKLNFDGLNAAHSHIDLGLLGRSLVGADRVVRDSLFLGIEGRLPKKRERLPVTVQVNAPAKGSVQILAWLQNNVGTLPIVHEMLIGSGSDYIRHVLSYMINRLGGRRKDAERDFPLMLEALKEIHAKQIEDRQHERDAFYRDAERWRQHVEEMTESLRGAVRELVSPVGPQAETLSVGDQRSTTVTVDVAMADAIRSKEDLEVGDNMEMRATIDGTILHSRSLKIELEGAPGKFVTAEVRDPRFDQTDNPYIDAMRQQAVVVLTVRPLLRPSGQTAKLYIMDMKGGVGGDS